MAELRKSGPYIWVTWLTKLLVGETSCEWAGWHRAHHIAAPRRTSVSLEQSGWLLDHTAAVQDCRAALEAQDYTVTTEGQNSFTLRGKTAALGGKPDLMALKDGTALVVDAKTGKPRASDIAQVMLYMYAVPRALSRYRGMSFHGRVMYRDHEVDVPARAVDDQFIERATTLIRRLASKTEARRVPGAQECRWCEISEANCPERVVAELQEALTDDF